MRCFSMKHFRHGPVINYDFHIHPMNTAPVIHFFQKFSHRRKHKFPDIGKCQCNLQVFRTHFIHNRKKLFFCGKQVMAKLISNIKSLRCPACKPAVSEIILLPVRRQKIPQRLTQIFFIQRSIVQFQGKLCFSIPE